MNDCYKLVLPIKGGVKTSFFIPLVKIRSLLQAGKPESQQKPSNQDKPRF